MSLRVRVLGLFLLLAVVTAAGTGALTWYEATRQVDQTIRASQRQLTAISTDLADYGRTHATWTGVDRRVAALAERYGQRIRLVRDAGAPLADSDLLAGRAARASVGPATLIDARPQLPPTRDGWSTTSVASVTIKRIVSLRRSMRYAACLTRAGIPVTWQDGAGTGWDRFGAIPVARAGAGADPADRAACRPAEPTTAEVTADHAALDRCPATDRVTRAYDACLRQRFTERVGTFAAPPAQLYLGARDQVPGRLSVLPILAGAGLVALLAVAAGLVLSRRVLRPVAELTTAARRLADGETAERVPVVGADELGQLARSFNTMADSLAESAARQRRQIADVAHELRTPLANLRGYLEALSDGVLTPDPALFSSLHEEALLQQRLVDDLHELALAEAGALSYHRTPTDLRELAAACRQAHAAAADAAGVTLTGPEPLGGTRTGPEPLGGTEPAAGERGDTADVDPDRLRQVVGNLLSNAVRATPAGGRVTIRVGRDGDTARIEVDDTGSGIDQADLPYVFDRFWRADPARTRGGSGLGLAVARQIVTDHGGTLTATSSPGAGSTFRVTLPALDPTGQSV